MNLEIYISVNWRQVFLIMIVSSCVTAQHVKFTNQSVATTVLYATAAFIKGTIIASFWERV